MIIRSCPRSQEHRLNLASSRTVLLIILTAFCVNPARSQDTPSMKAFDPYTRCTLSDELSVVETAPLAFGVTSRTVTTMKGPYQVPLSDGRRVMFAYPGENFYANVKVEILPAEGYAASKEALISAFEHTLASDDNSRNYALKPRLNGFEIQGLDRSKREGGVLGIYLFFDDPTRAVTTIYFLNQEPPKRFKTMQEYATLRDRFLNEYTSCIRKAITLNSEPVATTPAHP
jgi:hypothetical protein